MAEKVNGGDERSVQVTDLSRNRTKKKPVTKVDSGLGEGTEAPGSSYSYQVSDCGERRKGHIRTVLWHIK